MNCRGLGEFKKRRDVFHFLRKLNFSMYLLQDTHFHPSIEERIKREWGFDIFFASYNSNSRGVAILVNNNIEYKCLNVVQDPNGNYLILRIKVFDKDITIVNIYGPNDDNPVFYNDLQNLIINEGNLENIIVAGDFNLVMDFNLDCYNYLRQNNVNASNKVKEIVDNLDLIDIWRDKNPDCKRYSWRRSTPIQQSRLDFFLITDILTPMVKDVTINTGYRTDHSLITLTLQFEQEGERRQFWKFNSSLLHDKKYLDDINGVIKEVIEEYAVLLYNRETLSNIPISDISLSINDQLFLEVLLMKIRSKTISYSAFKKKKLEEQEKRLLSEIENLEKKHNLTEDDLKDIKTRKDDLVRLRDSRLRGVLLRSRARWVEDGEKVSSYFCAMEKRNYVNKAMNCLDINDEIVTDKARIAEEVKTFYETLYSKIDVQDLNISDLVENVPQINQAEAEQLEGILELDELSESLKNMKNRKSPGSDGFTVEFFKVFWGKLGGWVLRSLNEGFRKGELSQTQKEGVIICIPKGDEDRDKLRNWRPISLLNIVYKIGSSSIANRIKNVLPTIISEDQTGFIKNRFIGDNIRLIFDIMSWLDHNNKPGLLLCLDFQKAFDSLDWGFLHKSLKAFGFRDDICKWIKTFHNNIKSTISVNGNITEWFTVSRGCRQGDPLSPYIFIICVEILAIMIRENKQIKGITIDSIEHKIAQYADDSEIILEGDRGSFEVVRMGL